jgi:sigma-70-like protein
VGVGFGKSSARVLECEANTPWKWVKCSLAGGMSQSKRFTSCSAVNTSVTPRLLWYAYLPLQRRLGTGAKTLLEEVGEDFEVTRQRIRQIEAKALGRLALPTLANELAEALTSMSSPFRKGLVDWTFVPIPTRVHDPPGTLERLLGELAGLVGVPLDVRNCIRPMRHLPRHLPELGVVEGTRRPTAKELEAELGAVYELDGVTAPPRSAGVLLLGDVLGEGVHFRACKDVLQAAFHSCRVVGVFIAKMVRE